MFSKDQNIWIITCYPKENGLTQLRRDFNFKYKPVNKQTIPNRTAFKNVIAKVLEKESIEGCKADCERGRNTLPDTNISQIKEHFKAYPRSHFGKQVQK